MAKAKSSRGTFTPAEREYIEAHGGTVGVVTEKEAAEREAAHKREKKEAAPPPEKPEYYVDPTTGERVTREEYEKGQAALAKARKEQEPKEFVVPKGAEVIETTAKDEPAVYRTKEGERVYAPASTMYQIGYRTEAEYREAQRKSPEHPRAPYITVEEEGKLKHIPATREAIETYNWKSRKAYEKALREWAIQTPIAEAKALALRGYTEIAGNRYIKTSEFEALPPRFKSLALREGFDALQYAMAKEQRDFEAAHIKLKDKEGEDVWVPIDDWNKWPAKYQSIAIKRNLDKAMETQDADLAKFKSEHTKLADDTWIPNEEWNRIHSKYQDIGKRQGFKAMLATIREDKSRGTLAGNLERMKRASGWFNKVKALLGLTSGDVAEAQARFLTTPPVPEADEKTPKLSARQMLSILVPTLAEQAVETEKASFSEVLKAVVEAEKEKVEIGTTGLSLSISHLAPELTGKLKTFAEPLPVGLEQAVKFGGAVTLGALSAPIYSAIVTGHLAQASWAPNKVEKLTDLSEGIADFLISIPATIVAEPSLATGFYTGLFVVGPEGMAKIVKSVGARGVPSYIPARGMGIEYSVTRVPSKIANKAAVVKAVNEGITRAMRNKSGTATVKVGDGSVRLRIKPTPVSEIVGPALYHATPALTDALKKGQVKGTLYTSPHLAVRFAESSAKGTPQSNPAVLMIFTKDGKVKWSPTTNLYKGTKEMEAIYGATKFERVKSLWSRLTFDKFGDFITVHKGEIIPIYRFKEPGAAAPRISPADLISIRIKASAAALADLVKGRKGYEIIRNTAREAGRAEIELLAKPYEYLLKTLRKMYRANPDIERLYRLDPEQFERTYLRHLDREIRIITRKRPFIAGERFTEAERRQLERGIIPERLQRLQPREERIMERITTLRPPTEWILPEEVPPERLPTERVPPERIPPEQVPPERVPPERILPERIPVPEKPPPPILIGLKAKVIGKEAKLPEGSITWKQGWTWKWVPKEVWLTGKVRKALSLRKGITPMGARFVGERTPELTVQMIGDPGASVPDMSFDLGISDIYVTNNAQNIRFTGKGEQTNVGESIDSPTQGLTVGMIEPKGHYYAKPVKEKRSVSRTDVSKKTPIRGVQQLREGVDRVKITEDTEKMLEGEYVEPEPETKPKKDMLFDEDPNFWARFDQKPRHKSVNRVKHSRKLPSRKWRGDSLPTTLRGIKL